MSVVRIVIKKSAIKFNQKSFSGDGVVARKRKQKSFVFTQAKFSKGELADDI